jgi:hypothetical protein
MKPKKCHILVVRLTLQFLLMIRRWGLVHHLTVFERSFTLKRVQYHADAAVYKQRGIMKGRKVNLPDPATMLATVTVHSCEIVMAVNIKITVSLCV